jgi:hypothetical protein
MEPTWRFTVVGAPGPATDFDATAAHVRLGAVSSVTFELVEDDGTPRPVGPAVDLDSGAAVHGRSETGDRIAIDASGVTVWLGSEEGRRLLLNVERDGG